MDGHTSMTTFSRLTIPLLGLLILAACGSGDSNVGPTYEGGPVVCGALEASSYRYTLDAVFDVDNPDIVPPPANVRPGPPDSHFSTHVDAEVEDGDRFRATVTNDDGGSSTTFDAIVTGDRVYSRFGSGEWATLGFSEGASDPIPYQPASLCEAVAPDLDLGSLTGTLDEAIASQKFEIDSLAMDFPARTVELRGGDVDVLIETYDVIVWVAQEGSYISKVDLSGTGFYEDGTSLTFQLSYEISDMGGDSNVDPPN